MKSVILQFQSNISLPQIDGEVDSRQVSSTQKFAHRHNRQRHSAPATGSLAPRHPSTRPCCMENNRDNHDYNSPARLAHEPDRHLTRRWIGVALLDVDRCFVVCQQECGKCFLNKIVHGNCGDTTSERGSKRY